MSKETITEKAEEIVENVIEKAEEIVEKIEEKLEEKKEEKIEGAKTAEEKKKTSHSGMRKTRVGKVLSNKMDKTIIVSEEKRVMHPIYKKFFKKSTKFAAHDPKNTCDIGDTVKIMETRPLSKTKRWRLVEIVEKVK